MTTLKLTYPKFCESHARDMSPSAADESRTGLIVRLMAAGWSALAVLVPLASFVIAFRHASWFTSWFAGVTPGMLCAFVALPIIIIAVAGFTVGGRVLDP